MSLLLLLEDFNVLMLTACKFVDCHVKLMVGDNLERFCKCFFFTSTVLPHINMRIHEVA